MKKTLLSTVAFACLAVLSSNAMAGSKTYSTEPNYATYKKSSVSSVEKKDIDNNYYFAVRGLVGKTPHNLRSHDEGKWEKVKDDGRSFDDFVTTGGEAAMGTYLTDGVRVEVAYAYKENTSGNHSSSTEMEDGALVKTHLDQDLKQHLAMVNGYYDFNLGRFKPYVMAGIGYSKTKYLIKDKSTEDGVSVPDLKTHMSHSHLAWSVGAGFGFDLTEHFTFEAGYRFTDAGQIKGYPKFSEGLAEDEDSTLLKYKTRTHEVLAGIRYSF
ncbi:MAG: outer membrane beta-barrel protein [Alphaproteobacteria bacterium]|nr:outer membrane beta-barrel protein [Alphaproteobacteria bacterium]